MPMLPTPCRKPPESSRAVAGSSGAWARIPPTMNAAWLITKSRKMGASDSADSRAPRRLRVHRQRMKKASTGSLAPAQWSGRKLKMASPAAAIETVMVKT